MKRILPPGEPTNGEREGVERSLEEVARGARTVYPILKAWDWPAKEHCIYTHYLDSETAPFPLVAYGYDSKDNYVFITKRDNRERSVDALHAEALDNLRRLHIAWQHFDDDTLTGAGHDFSAEKLLDDHFILEAERTLGTDRISVAVPRRRVIYASRTEAPEKTLDRFYRIIAYTLSDDSFGNAIITNLVFQFEGTNVVGAKKLG